MPQQLESDLKTYFNHSSFRPGQKAIIEDVLNEKNVLAILPTGSGKSLCYQLPAKRLDGLTIIVSPLISLMMDQIKQLKARQFKDVAAVNSFLNPEQRHSILSNLNKYKLIYISPELLQNAFILSYFNRCKISLFVIDEAHCISQWGHEFRPDYLKLASIIEHVNNPPVLALSATAPPQVQNDIIAALNKPDMQKHIHPMDRENIAFVVEKTPSAKDKMTVLVKLLNDHQGPAIIYFSSRQLTQDIAMDLSVKQPNRHIAYYHGGMEQSDRLLIQQQFMNDQIDVICCTSAFGMGIDKNDIRLVIHYHLPIQVESYLQEIGRAGRDGLESAAVLLYSESDRTLAENLLVRELPEADSLDSVYRILKRLADQYAGLPADDTVINETNLNEVQWRFLKQQLQNYNVIIDKRLNHSKEAWEQARMAITSYIDKRLRYKQDKLRQMIDWIEETECLRYHLYKHFQNSYSVKKHNCCSNCGYDSSTLPLGNVEHHPPFKTWENKLKNLLLQE